MGGVVGEEIIPLHLKHNWVETRLDKTQVDTMIYHVISYLKAVVCYDRAIQQMGGGPVECNIRPTIKGRTA